MNNDIKEVLYSKEQIAEVTKKLGKQITKDFEGKNPLVVCVLKGAVMFTTDIIREIDTYLELDFMDVSSYGEGTESSGEVKIIKDLDTSVTGRDVLIVEDIIDTGRTLQRLVELFKHDYVGFEVPNEFVVGYGLDFAGRYRNLGYVGILKPEVYEG